MMAVAQREIYGRQPEHPSRRAAAIVIVALAGVYLLSIFFRPADGAYFTICGFRNLTGLPCPGCGLTHSFCALGKGHFLEALEYNILGPPLFFFSLIVWARSLSVLAGRKRLALALDRAISRIRPAHLFVIAFLVFGAGRILYLLIYHPAVVQGTPLSRLAGWIIG